MSYPADPLDVVVEIAPGSDPADDPAVYNWVDISQYWRTGTSAINISRGRQSPLSDTVPSQCTLTLDNTDGRFSSRNPIGAYYPDLLRNTPLRVRLRQFYDEFGRTVDAWGPVLNTNPYFETTASPWTAIGGGTVARSTAQFHEGVASLLLTPNGVTTNPEARSENMPATEGGVYQSSAWVRSTTTRNVSINLHFRNSGGTMLAANTATWAVTAGTWTRITSRATAPAGTTQAQIGVWLPGTPPGSDVLYIDEAMIQAEAGGWSTSTSGHTWLTDGTASQVYVDGSAGVHAVNALNTVFRSRTSGLALSTVTLRTTVRLAAAPTGNYIRTEPAVRLVDVNNYYALRVHVLTSGAIDLQLILVDGGVETLLASVTSGITHTAGVALHLMIQAVGDTLRGMVWRDDADQPTAWQITADDSTHTTGDIAVTTLFPPGNTNTLPYNVIYDSLDVSSTRFTGYVDRWPARWDTTGNNRWVPVTAYGTLKRLATAGLATQSALYRYISAQPWQLLAGYWPCEDGPLAGEAANRAIRRNQFRSAPPGLAPSAPVKFGVASPAGGVGTMVDTSGAYLHVRLGEHWAEDWRVECVVAHDQAPTGTVRVLSWLTPGTIQRWDLNTGTSGYQLVGWTAVSGGTAVVTVNSGVAAQPGVLQHLRVDVTLSGTTNTAAVYVDGTFAGSGTYSPSVTLRPTVMRVNPDASQDVPLVGHVAIWAGTPLPATASADVALGAPGEQAHERIEAVCLERAVPYAATTTATSQTMGPRPGGSLVALLRECEATDGGILYELTSGHLAYKPRTLLYNQPVTMALDYAQGHIGEPFEPADDDSQLRNDVTARRPSASEATYVDDDHIAAVGRYEIPLSANPDDDAALEQLAAWAVHRGTPAEQRFDAVGVLMSRVGASVIGQWLACDIGSRITVEGVPEHLTPDDVDVILVGYTETFQYPRVWGLELVCEPASVWTVGELDDPVLGRLDTAGSELASGNVSAQIRGDAANRAIVSTADAAFFSVGNRVVLHDPDGRRKEPTVFTITAKTGPAFGVYDLFLDPMPAETVLGNFTGDYDSVRRVDETSLSVATTSGAVWTTNAAHVPFDLNLDGERVTVTAVSGAASPQTLTVVRAVNGVEKGHPAGTAVRLWQPLILGL